MTRIGRLNYIDGFTVWGAFSFLHPHTFDLCTSRDPMVFCFTEAEANEAMAEYEKNPDEKYDFFFVEEDRQLDP